MSSRTRFPRSFLALFGASVAFVAFGSSYVAWAQGTDAAEEILDDGTVKPLDLREPEKVEIPEQPSPDVGSSTNAPPMPTDPSALELRRALEEANQELEELKSEYALETDELGAEVARLEKEASDVRENQRALERQLREFDQKIVKAAEAAEGASKERAKAEENVDLTVGELQSQLARIGEQWTGTVASAQDPAFIETAAQLKQGSKDALPERIESLVDLYVRALDYAGSVSTFESRIQLPSQGGKLGRVEILRMGLLGGYYAEAHGDEVGYVLTDSEGESGLKGEHRGVDTTAKAEIRAAIADPSQGGFLPMDVTGGAGVAALQTRQSLTRWFEAGGFAMWPLLAVFLASVILIIERGIVLTLKSVGIRRRTEKVLALVRSGRVEDAEELCAKMGGAVGTVLHSALVHRGKGRAVMEDAVQEALLHQAPRFQTRLGFIALCAAVAPLMGLFGTVTGMISTFKMVTLFGTSDPRFMAGGISEALITTETGLLIAIPSLLMRGVLGAIADSALHKLEAGALSVVIELVKAEEELESIKEAA